jgi:hypothetical protein
MNSESNSKIQGTQSGKPASYKRAHRAKRPVLVTGQESVARVEVPSLDLAETESPSAVALEERSTGEDEAGHKRRPRFFSSVGRAEKNSDQPKVDPMAARLARALRGKGAGSSKDNDLAQEKKVATSVSKPGTTTPARPKSTFKMKYIWGMMFYLLVADFLGVWIQNWMKAQGLDAPAFALGAFQASRSTLVFLALLIIILVLMARFDLIPRSLGAAMSGQSSQRKDGPKTGAKTPTFTTKEAQPAIKQGVKGTNDDLYREYRETQRYFQKRDRKR